jgi:predicted porin
MKKHLIAAAVAAAVAAPAAFAQSNVEIYGILDVSAYHSLKADAKTNAGVKTTNKQTDTGYTSGYTTSRLGFRGTEDLGNGLKAMFNYELGINNIARKRDAKGDLIVDQGGDTSNPFVVRQANLGISGGFGSVRLGRMTTAAETVWLVGDIGSGNNFIGRLYGSSTRVSETRGDSLIEYNSPTFNGFGVTLQHGKRTIDFETAETFSNIAYDKNKAKMTGANLRYNNGPLNVGLGYSKETIEGFAKEARWDGSVFTDVTPKELVLGANYNFGVARVFAIYADTSEKNNANGAKDDRDGWELGVAVPLGAVTLQASLYEGDRTQKTAAGVKTKTDRDGYQVAALYSLSKRTMAYAVYGTSDSDVKNGTKTETTQYGFGIRHSF